MLLGQYCSSLGWGDGLMVCRWDYDDGVEGWDDAYSYCGGVGYYLRGDMELIVGATKAGVRRPVGTVGTGALLAGLLAVVVFIIS